MVTIRNLVTFKLSRNIFVSFWLVERKTFFSKGLLFIVTIRRGSGMGGGGGGYKCQLSVKISAICQLSVKWLNNNRLIKE